MSQAVQRHSAKRTVSNNPPIANEINAATRSLHTELNRLIIDRLPLALPPSATSAKRYTAGISKFAGFFFHIEQAFKQVTEKAPSLSKDRDEHCAAVARWVTELVPRDLFRSARLQADLEHLRLLGYSSQISSPGHDRFANLIGHALDKPHVLVACAWVMYMAIFSGGRWIRSELTSAGPGFWLGLEEAAGLQIDDLPGFSFLSFDDAQDGEGLKTAFKVHLEGADSLLTATERQEVVDFGIEVFEHCISLVKQIDKDVWWAESMTSWPAGLLLLCIGILYLIWSISSGRLPFAIG